MYESYIRCLRWRNRREAPTCATYQTGQYWDVHSSFHEEDAGFKVANFRRLIGLTRSDTADLSLLDIGCASGEFLRRLRPHFDGRLVGCDLSTAAIDRAKASTTAGAIDFELGSVDDLDETFDIVTLNDVFEHVDDYIGFLRQVRDVGTTFYFHIPLDMYVLSLARHTYMSARRRFGHLHYFTPPSAVATLECCGYEVVAQSINSVARHAARTKPRLRTRAAVVPRIVGHRVSPAWSANWLKDATLSVVAQPRRAESIVDRS